MVRSAHGEGRVELVIGRQIAPVNRIIILKETDFRHGENPESLVSIAIVNVIGAVGGGILENAGELGPLIAAGFDIIVRLGRLLP
jgi:hypothetical protein